ncbi:MULTISPECIES: hypothetical protein [Fusobacterium]|uniref:hypothetical protein n=1 Tax=Fusobacterium TaxID=848 RepID=UPI00021378BD|nr:hypothetical protein [Fusobacterium animalis]EGN65218.1 hypothetical protein HMPREF0404_00592 [Fusobacterium animalis 21_1A]
MKIKFERVYGKHKIGDIVEFEKGEELNYILTTKTALIIEDDDFENNEIDEAEAEDNSDRENSEDNNEAGKSGKNKKK